MNSTPFLLLLFQTVVKNQIARFTFCSDFSFHFHLSLPCHNFDLPPVLISWLPPNLHFATTSPLTPILHHLFLFCNTAASSSCCCFSFFLNSTHSDSSNLLTMYAPSPHRRVSRRCSKCSICRCCAFPSLGTV